MSARRWTGASRFCLAPSGLVEPLFCRGEAMIARRFLFVNSEYYRYMQIIEPAAFDRHSVNMDPFSAWYNE
ncbi:hypothetical protein [Paraburkholderia eburnea]|uniref:hypothetical protein n=1 Tax=Paraburkholderia eburnea TaxID=1189126 RepID=UPI000CDB4D2C|nr:hypothetical protein [Paraburkholderia eburnea]